MIPAPSLCCVCCRDNGGDNGGVHGRGGACVAVLLSQDPFGNYVIQYILQKGTWEQARSLMSKLPGHMQQLSAQVCTPPVLTVSCVFHWEGVGRVFFPFV